MTRARVGVEALRQQVGRAVEAASLRAVAEEIGVSWSGLRSFLQGSTPQRGSLLKLVAWQVGRRPGDAGPNRIEATAAVELLAQFVAAGRTDVAKARRLQAVMQEIESRLPEGFKIRIDPDPGT